MHASFHGRVAGDIASCPRTVHPFDVGKFVERLTEILGTSESPTDSARLTALLQVIGAIPLLGTFGDGQVRGRGAERRRR